MLPAAVLGAFAVLAAAWLAGRVLTPELKPCLSFGVGATAVSYAVFALMLAGRASLPALSAILALAIVAGLWRRGISFTIVTPGRTPWLTLVVLAPFVVWYAVNSLAPEVHTDPNVYHLRPAADSLRFGGFSGIIDFYDRLPHAVEMLFVPAWRIGGSSAAKLVHFAFLLATLPLIVHLGRLWKLPQQVAFGAAALYFCTPVVGFAGVAAFNDAALVYFTLAAVALAIEDRPWHAGWIAGFCYGVKMTGLLAVPVAMAFFLLRKQHRRAVPVGLAAALACLPWLLRNWLQTGNPLAPFLNAWFPNPYFYVWTERNLTLHLRTYGVPLQDRFSELFIGSLLQGILGPTLMIAPLAVFAVRKRNGLALLALAAVFSIPWWMNAGARFTMASLPFLAFAVCIAIPRRAIAPLVVLHAITSWPAVVQLYSPAALHLREFPIRAAFRLEPEDGYLFRSSYDYRYLQMVERNSPDDAHILDLWGMPTVYSGREFMGWWRTAQGVRLVEALDLASLPNHAPLVGIHARFHPQPLCGYRATLTSQTTTPWAIHTMEARAGVDRVKTGGDRFATSSKRRWETPFAFDANPVSRWSTGQAGQTGDFLQVDLTSPAMADSVRLTIPSTTPPSSVQIEICREGAWSPVDARVEEAPELNLKPAAVALLKQAGITHIVVPFSSEGTGVLGSRLVKAANDWNFQVAGDFGGAVLLRLR